MALSGVRSSTPGLEVIKLEYSLRLRIKCNDWLLADTCPQAANHCAHVSASSQSLRFIFSLRMNSSFITSRPGRSSVGKLALSFDLVK